MINTARYLVARLTALLIAITLSSGLAYADTFQERMAETYSAYRTAASYLRTGNAGLASLDLAYAADEWKALRQAATESPPAEFSKDAQFVKTLEAVERRLDDGLAFAEQGNAKRALESITPIRTLIYELRMRNGHRLYADCITDLNTAMDSMWIYRHNPPDFAKAATQEHTAKVRDTYETLLAECVDMAPEDHLDNAEFVRLMENTRSSTQALGTAIEAHDTSGYISVLRELRSLDRIVFFRFGS